MPVYNYAPWVGLRHVPRNAAAVSKSRYCVGGMVEWLSPCTRVTREHRPYSSAAATDHRHTAAAINSDTCP